MDERIVLLREAIQWQTEVMLATILGYGVDNHLLGLRETAKLVFDKLPEFFQDETYKESQRFRLSTSQVRGELRTGCWNFLILWAYSRHTSVCLLLILFLNIFSGYLLLNVFCFQLVEGSMPIIQILSQIFFSNDQGLNCKLHSTDISNKW